MRIHTTASYTDLTYAANLAGVQIERTEHRSRSGHSIRAWEVHLTGNSNRAPSRRRTYSGEKAATWDQWGVFLAYIFAEDPAASCWAYENAVDFHYKTDWRFADGRPEDAHGDHKWEFQGVPRQQSCTKCTAVRSA